MAPLTQTFFLKPWIHTLSPWVHTGHVLCASSDPETNTYVWTEGHASLDAVRQAWTCFPHVSVHVPQRNRCSVCPSHSLVTDSCILRILLRGPHSHMCWVNAAVLTTWTSSTHALHVAKACLDHYILVIQQCAQHSGSLTENPKVPGTQFAFSKYYSPTGSYNRGDVRGKKKQI